MNYLLAFCFLLIPTTHVFSQNEPVPAYLVTQDFPDSVKQLGVETFSGTTTNFGKLIESFRGKKILIDIWASWCGDCITGYPKLDELRNKLRHENVVVIFLSVDKDKQKWKNAIAKYNLQGDHYLLDNAWKNTLANYLVLDWVPRYLVLSEQGMIIMPKAITAEDPVLRNIFSVK